MVPDLESSTREAEERGDFSRTVGRASVGHNCAVKRRPGLITRRAGDEEEEDEEGVNSVDSGEGQQGGRRRDPLRWADPGALDTKDSRTRKNLSEDNVTHTCLRQEVVVTLSVDGDLGYCRLCYPQVESALNAGG